MAGEVKGKQRHCLNCGADMGFVEDRFWDRLDVCGAEECNRAQRDAYAQEREQAHENLDRDMGYW
jgi:hypothetical protein